MLSRKTFIAAALLGCGCATTQTTTPATGQAGGQTGGQASVASANPGEGTMTDSQGRKVKIICTMERSTGSNIAEKVCRPESQPGDRSYEVQDLLLGPAARSGGRGGL